MSSAISPSPAGGCAHAVAPCRSSPGSRVAARNAFVFRDGSRMWPRTMMVQGDGVRSFRSAAFSWFNSTSRASSCATSRRLRTRAGRRRPQRARARGDSSFGPVRPCGGGRVAPRPERQVRGVHLQGIGRDAGRPDRPIKAGCAMTSGPAYHEDLPCIAAEGFQLADRLCRGCGQLHALWPYIRLARATSAGLEDASSQLQAVLSGLFAAGRRHVLVAGAADTGLLGARRPCRRRPPIGYRRARSL